LSFQFFTTPRLMKGAILGPGRTQNGTLPIPLMFRGALWHGTISARWSVPIANFERSGRGRIFGGEKTAGGCPQKERHRPGGAAYGCRQRWPAEKTLSFFHRGDLSKGQASGYRLPGSVLPRFAPGQHLIQRRGPNFCWSCPGNHDVGARFFCFHHTAPRSSGRFFRAFRWRITNPKENGRFFPFRVPATSVYDSPEFPWEGYRGGNYCRGCFARAHDMDFGSLGIGWGARMKSERGLLSVRAGLGRSGIFFFFFSWGCCAGYGRRSSGQETESPQPKKSSVPGAASRRPPLGQSRDFFWFFALKWFLNGKGPGPLTRWGRGSGTTASSPRGRPHI